MRVAAKILGSIWSRAGRYAARRERVLQGNMPHQLLTIADAATTLRLHPATLRALAAAGAVPAFKVGRTWHVMAGTTIAELQELGAWKSELMVKRYAHVAPEQLRSAATRLGTFLGTPGSAENAEARTTS
jgi:hypothetical protein